MTSHEFRQGKRAAEVYLRLGLGMTHLDQDQLYSLLVGWGTQDLPTAVKVVMEYIILQLDDLINLRHQLEQSRDEILKIREEHDRAKSSIERAEAQRTRVEVQQQITAIASAQVRDNLALLSGELLQGRTVGSKKLKTQLLRAQLPCPWPTLDPRGLDQVEKWLLEATQKRQCNDHVGPTILAAFKSPPVNWRDDWQLVNALAQLWQPQLQERWPHFKLFDISSPLYVTSVESALKNS